MWSTIAQNVSALTNIPMDRVYQKIMNLREASDSTNEAWQRIALAIGYNTWDLSVENTEVLEAEKEIDAIKKEAKKAKEKERKEEKKKKKEKERKEREAREVQCSAFTRKGKGPRCKNRTENKSGKCYAHQ